jgi:hypothetical protein
VPRIGLDVQQKLIRGHNMQAIMIEGLFVIPTLVPLGQIKVGDTILHNGKLKTVSRSNIKHDSFMGLTLFGDSYHIKRKVIKCKIFNGLKFI